jgi:hypothetical protein
VTDVEASIAKHGWHAISVDDHDPPFLYAIGARGKLWMFIRAFSEGLWWFGDCQNTSRSADGQLLSDAEVL